MNLLHIHNLKNIIYIQISCNQTLLLFTHSTKIHNLSDNIYI